MHQIIVKELVNGVEIKETINDEVVVKLLSYNSKPFFRTTNEDDTESFQILDRLGEIYHLPALATEFVLIDIERTYYIPADGVELIAYSYKLKIFRPENEVDKVLALGEIDTTADLITVNVPEIGLPNSFLINGSVYDKYYKSEFGYTPVVEFIKILIVYAKPDAQIIHLAEGAESTEAVEPDYDGLFIARIIVDSGGEIVEDSEVGYKPLAEDPWRNIIISNNTAVNVVMASSPSCSFNVLVGVGSTAPKIAGIRTKFTKNTRDGQEITFYNDSDTPVAFLSGDYEETSTYTNFPFEEEYELKPRSFAKFKRKNNKYKLLPAGGGTTGDYIPLTGTEVGKPVDGIFDATYETIFKYENNNIINSIKIIK